MIAGMIGAKTSAMTVMARWMGFWFCLAASLAASFVTPSMPETATKSS